MTSIDQPDLAQAAADAVMAGMAHSPSRTVDAIARAYITQKGPKALWLFSDALARAAEGARK
jgi:hypothetical protein